MAQSGAESASDPKVSPGLRCALTQAGETIDVLRRVISASNRSGAGEVIDLPVSRRN
jgi:hypothetical protein